MISGKLNVIEEQANKLKQNFGENSANTTTQASNEISHDDVITIVEQKNSLNYI